MITAPTCSARNHNLTAVEEAVFNHNRRKEAMTSTIIATIKKSTVVRALSLFTVVVLAASAQAATIQTINVNWWTEPYVGSPYDSPYTGQAILPATGDIWNNFNTRNDSHGSLVDSGNTPTSVGFTMTGSASMQAPGGSSAGNLARSSVGGTSSSVTTVTFNGLAEGSYTVAVMGVRVSGGGNTQFTVDSIQQVTGTPNGTDGDPDNLAPANWAVYENVSVDVSGILVVSALPGPEPSYGQSYLNAVQIQSVPEPATAMLFGLPLIGLVLRRRR